MRRVMCLVSAFSKRLSYKWPQTTPFSIAEGIGAGKVAVSAQAQSPKFSQ